VRALLKAAAGRELRLMFPMVTELSEFLHLGVGMLHIIFLWQACRVVDADVAAETEQDPGALVG
jgi:signal transduction protein with GAF and PtsI domain